MVKIVVTIKETPTGMNTSVGGDAEQDTTTLAEALTGAILKTKINSIVSAGPLALLADSECMGNMREQLNDLMEKRRRETQHNGENN